MTSIVRVGKEAKDNWWKLTCILGVGAEGCASFRSPCQCTSSSRFSVYDRFYSIPTFWLRKHHGSVYTQWSTCTIRFLQIDWACKRALKNSYAASRLVEAISKSILYTNFIGVWWVGPWKHDQLLFIRERGLVFVSRDINKLWSLSRASWDLKPMFVIDTVGL